MKHLLWLTIALTAGFALATTVITMTHKSVVETSCPK
jgi:hypothetical protein